MFSRRSSNQDMARGYVDRQFNKELPRLAGRARRQWDHLDLGGVAGGILALLWAPKAGAQARTEVKQRAQDLMGQGKARLQEQPVHSNIRA